MVLPRLLALLLLCTMVSLGSLAYASPPDPGWIGGFWDDSDYDDVVILVANGVGVADSHPPQEPSAEIFVALVAPPGPDLLLASPRASWRTRAPPAA